MRRANRYYRLFSTNERLWKSFRKGSRKKRGRTMKHSRSNWRVNYLGKLRGYFEEGDNENETKRNDDRILDRRILREPCSENESHVDANVIIVREKSWQLSSNRITPSLFVRKIFTRPWWRTFMNVRERSSCRMCHETLKRKDKFFPKISRRIERFTNFESIIFQTRTDFSIIPRFHLQ